MKKYLILLILLLIIPFKTKACTTSDMAIINKIYGNIQITNIFDENTEKFNIIVSNLNQNVYFYDTFSKTYVYPNGPETIIYGVNPGQNIRFKFYGNYNTCSSEHISSKYITLPSYNPLYKDPLCVGNENLKVCQKWAKVNYKYEEFKKEIKKNNEVTNSEEENQEKILGFYDYLIIYYQKYYYFVFPAIIIICLVLIIKENKKSKLY